MAWTSRTAALDEGVIPYLETGDTRSSDTLVLVHAFPVGVRLWEPVAVPAGWRALAPALPGFDGALPPAADTTSIDDYARSVLALMDHLQIARAVVGGVSMGGYVAFALWRLARERCRGFVLADTRAGADSAQAREGRESMLDTVRRQGTRGVADAMIPKLLGETTRARNPGLVNHVRALIERQTPDGVAAAVMRLRDRPDSTALLPGIHVPVLVAVGEEDVVTPPAESEMMATQLPDARLARVPAAGHLACMENPAAFNAALEEFLTAFPR
jgi:pimeloyl-ACP methyl ester carboxylesterase